VTDSNGNAALEVTRTVNVVDTEKPVITLIGDDSVTVQVHSAYDELGATVSDNYDTGLVAAIDASAVDIDSVGSYIVEYDAVDSSGNKADQKIRTVNVVDTEKPVITLIGNNPETVLVNSGAYSDAGSTVSDNYDVGLVANVTGSVDTDTVGSYTLYFNVTDSNGNAALEVTRTVNVSELVITKEASNTPTEDSIIITWTTDHPATSRVVYDTVSHSVLGAAPNYGYANSTAENAAKVTSHSVTLTGLDDSTTYYYRVISHGSPEMVGPEKSFTTSKPSSHHHHHHNGNGGGGGGGSNSGTTALLASAGTTGGEATAIQGQENSNQGSDSVNQNSQKSNGGPEVLGEGTQSGARRIWGIWWLWIIFLGLVGFVVWLFRRKKTA
jgi:hypothetical protein